MITRPDVLAAGTATLAAHLSPAAAQTAQKTFVLVHGAWHGGWCWRSVVDLLQTRGHKVFAPTLTGLGERSHLLDAKVDLTMHVTDIVNLIKWERLNDIVLVGHSYGGMVITGVAERTGSTISSIVYLDAFVPENGQSVLDLVAGTPVADAIRATAEKGEIGAPAPPAEFFHVNEKDRAWVDAMCTPQPVASVIERITETGLRNRILRKTYIRAIHDREPFFDAFLAKYRSTSGWRTYEVPSGHDVMIDLPERLTEILLEMA
jgi:pimeloyl-ACP methyl ester carboxylesterase